MTIRILIYDTETTGLPLKWIPAEEDLTNYPNLLQLGAKIIEVDLDKIDEPLYGGIKEVYTLDTKVIPFRKGIPVEIHPKALATHGITFEECNKEGNLLETVLFLFQGMINSVDVIVCHNTGFDRNVMVSELLNIGIKPISKKGTKTFCTMKHSTDILKIPGFKAGQYKYPRLEELYKHYKNSELTDNYKAHDALGDVCATRDCLLEMIRTDEPLLEWLKGEREQLY